MRTSSFSWVGAGALLVLVLSGLLPDARGLGPRASSRTEPGRSTGASASRVEVWLTDRDGNRVVGLDRDLIEVVSVALRAPIEIEGCRDGGAWVVSAIGGSPVGEQLLVRLAANGSVVTTAPVATVIDLATVGESALVIELGTATGSPGRGSRDRALLVDERGEITVLIRGVGLRTASTPNTGAASRVVVGTEDGRLLVLDPARARPQDLGDPPGTGSDWRPGDGGGFGAGPALVSVLRPFGADVPAILGDLAPGPDPGTLWVLDISGGGRLGLLDRDLELRWQTAVGLQALHVVPDPASRGAWLASTTGRLVRRYGPDGGLELAIGDLPLSGLDRGVSWLDGGVLLTAPGALLHLDAGGGLAPGQGGFDFLVDVARPGL